MSDGRTPPLWLESGIAGALVVFGGALALAAYRLPGGSEPNVPGPGAVPGMLGLLLVGCGVILALQAWAGRRTNRIVSAEDGSGRKALLAVALVGGAVLGLEPLGFLLTSMLFLSAGFTAMGGARWTTAVPAAALASTALWLFFTKLLGVGLPYGLIAEILFR